MKDHREILITGATGAIGPSVCASLLQSDPSRSLAIAVRPDDNGVSHRFAAFSRLLESVIFERGIAIENWQDRIKPVEADLRADGLGLSTAARSDLHNSVDRIIHAAADTQFASSPDDQWNINVEGTRRILDLARAGRRDTKVILVSTICTSGRTTGRIHETPVFPRPTFVNNYERTKWEAEQLALADDVPLAIARVSVVLGSAASGTVHRMGAVHHLLKWFARGLIPVMTGLDQSRLDVISSDFVGDFLARAAKSDWPAKSIWNVAAGDDASQFSEFSEMCWETLRPGEVMENIDRPGEPFLVDEATFDEVRRTRTARGQRVSQQAMNSISTFAPMLACPRVYDRTHAKQLWGGELPTADWRETLLKVLKGFAVPSRRAVMAA